MFNNLIESSSHVNEFKRRGSFLAFTTATYVVLFVITGVVSIYAYDARLEEQSLEVVTLLPPQEIAPDPAPVEHTSQPKPTNGDRADVAERAIPMLSVNHPEVVPDTVSATPSKNKALPDHGRYVISGVDRDVVGSGQPGPPSGGRVAISPPQVVLPDDPPPAPAPAAPKIIRVSEVLNSKALVLPRPAYPPMAKQIRLQGTVVVQVLIDESGRVLSAKAVSGHPILVPDSVRAAMQARFSATTINGTPVKVSGMISYNFQMPQ